MDTYPTRILTIGCSCINRFQFDVFQALHPDTVHHFVKSLFDWNIVSLIGTETLLQHAVDGHLQALLEDTSEYVVDYGVLLFHRHLPGICFFHEQDIAKAFDDPAQKDSLVSKLAHQAAPFLAPDYEGRTHLVWSNVQPNLPGTVRNVTPWDDFQLTAPRYAKITSLGRQLFGPDTTFTFLTLVADATPEALQNPDVHMLTLPRSADYQGPPDLYAPFLSQILDQTHN
ncbi:MAG: hypothetical protein ACSHXH_04740 [Marivita sp.]|uniref:hypothetical protein n=1 Tax=Marivita sp. TaxID=2003365 RepID=UPI003EF27035